MIIFFYKKEFSHKDTKALRENTSHFLCFVPQGLRGKLFYAAMLRNFLLIIIVWNFFAGKAGRRLSKKQDGKLENFVLDISIFKPHLNLPKTEQVI